VTAIAKAIALLFLSKNKMSK